MLSAEKDDCKIRIVVKDLMFTWGRKLSIVGMLAAFEGAEQFFCSLRLEIESILLDAAEVWGIFALDLCLLCLTVKARKARSLKSVKSSD